MFRLSHKFLPERNKLGHRLNKENDLAVSFVMFPANKFFPDMPFQAPLHQQLNLLSLTVHELLRRPNLKTLQQG